MHELLAAVGSEGKALCIHLRPVAQAGAGLIGKLTVGYGAACGHVGIAGGKAHADGYDGALVMVVAVHAEVALGSDVHAVAHTGQGLGRALDQVHSAAYGQGILPAYGRGVGHGDVPHLIVGIGADFHVAGGAYLAAVGHVAYGGGDLVGDVRQGNCGSHGGFGGSDAHAAGNDAGGGRAVGGDAKTISLVVLIQAKAGIIADLCPDAVAGKEGGQSTRQICGSLGGGVQAAGYGFHIVVYHGKVIYHVKDVHDIVGADGTLYSDLGYLVELLGQSDIKQAFFRIGGIVHCTVYCEQVGPVKGELIQALIHQGTLGVHGEGIGHGGEVVAYESVDIAAGIEHGGGGPHAQGLPADVGPQGTDGQLAEVYGLNKDVSPGGDADIVPYLGNGVGIGTEDGHGSRQAQSAVHAGGNGGGYGLGAHIGREVAGSILAAVDGDIHVAFGIDANTVGHVGLGAVAVDGDCHGGGCGIGPLRSGGYGGAGGTCAEVCVIDCAGFHIARLGAHVAEYLG